MKLLEMSKSGKRLKPKHLPLAKKEAVQHALWVYLQITYWKTLSNTEIDHRLWGWKTKNELFELVMTHK